LKLTETTQRQELRAFFRKGCKVVLGKTQEREMIIYGLKNCDTCRKALKALPNAELVDVSVNSVPDGILDRAMSQFGEKILNTKSTTWRGLDAAERETDPKALLVAHPKLMKRPLIVDGDVLYLSWDKGTQAALLG
jgi:arsenate reductase